MESKKFDQTKLIEFLNNKRRKNNKCINCDQNNWHISDEIYELRAFRGGNMIMGGIPIVPLVPVTCNNCGNTILINAMVANLLNKPESDGTEKE